MKKDFLNSLKDLPLWLAKRNVEDNGHEVLVVPREAQAIPAVALGNTVVLWQTPKGMILRADAGDPLELED